MVHWTESPAGRKKEEKRERGRKQRKKPSTIQARENAKHFQKFAFFTLKSSGIHNPITKGLTSNLLEYQNSEG